MPRRQSGLECTVRAGSRSGRLAGHARFAPSCRGHGQSGVSWASCLISFPSAESGCPATDGRTGRRPLVCTYARSPSGPRWGPRHRADTGWAPGDRRGSRRLVCYRAGPGPGGQVPTRTVGLVCLCLRPSAGCRAAQILPGRGTNDVSAIEHLMAAYPGVGDLRAEFEALERREFLGRFGVCGVHGPGRGRVD